MNNVYKNKTIEVSLTKAKTWTNILVLESPKNKKFFNQQILEKIF